MLPHLQCMLRHTEQYLHRWKEDPRDAPIFILSLLAARKTQKWPNKLVEGRKLKKKKKIAIEVLLGIRNAYSRNKLNRCSLEWELLCIYVLKNKDLPNSWYLFLAINSLNTYPFWSPPNIFRQLEEFRDHRRYKLAGLCVASGLMLSVAFVVSMAFLLLY